MTKKSYPTLPGVDQEKSDKLAAHYLLMERDAIKVRWRIKLALRRMEKIHREQRKFMQADLSSEGLSAFMADLMDLRRQETEGRR